MMDAERNDSNEVQFQSHPLTLRTPFPKFARICEHARRIPKHAHSKKL